MKTLIENESQMETDFLVASAKIQLLLSEKRTALSLARTGMAAFALSLGMLSLLAAAARYTGLSDATALLVPLVIITFFPTVLGGYMIAKSILKSRRSDYLVHQLKLECSAIAEYVE